MSNTNVIKIDFYAIFSLMTIDISAKRLIVKGSGKKVPPNSKCGQTTKALSFLRLFQIQK